jgi:hypothetical protein
MARVDGLVDSELVSIQMISPVKGKASILNPSWAKVSQAVCEGQQN